jgi:hypothetical protein
MRKFLSRTKLYVFALPLLLCSLGAGLNQIAINTNHDTMPVLYNAGNVRQFIADGYPIESHGEILTDPRHSVLTPESHFYILCDILDFGDEKYSLGDVFISGSKDLAKGIPYVWGLALYAALCKKDDEKQY